MSFILSGIEMTQSKKILLVEDEPIAIYIASNILEELEN